MLAPDRCVRASLESRRDERRALAGNLRGTRSMPQVVGMLQLVPRVAERSQILALLRARAELVRARDGCLKSDVYQDAGDQGALVYLEVWRDEPSASEHLRSPDYDLLLALMEASEEPPLLEFFFVSETRGVSWVAELRDVR